MGRVSYSSVSGIVWRKGALYSIYIGSNKTMMKGSKRYDSKITVFFPPISNCYSACSGMASIMQAYDSHNPALFLNRLFLFRKTNYVLKFAVIEKTNGITIANCGERYICDLLIENLNNNEYVFLPLDHFYIRKSSHFGLNHFIHDVTIVYGYDTDKRVFY